MKKPTLTLRDFQAMQPLIIIGMHRSGTSLLVRVLKELGFFMGYRLSRDAESIYFQKLNRRIYKSVGAKWAVVNSLINAMRIDSFVSNHMHQIKEILFTHKTNVKTDIRRYFGPVYWRTILQDQNIPWGFKDPRTMLTLPIWLGIFPNARVLHIIRNGVDVAISLHRRSLKQKKKIWKQMIPLDYCPETLDFKYCFQLWEDYLSFFGGIKHMLPVNNYLEIKFEDFLSDPETQIRDISAFMSYAPPAIDKSISAAVQQIDRRRLDNTAFAVNYKEIIPSLLDSEIMRTYNYSY